MALNNQHVPPQPQCALLRMPAELRNTIYHLILCQPPSTGAGKSGDESNVVDIKPILSTTTKHADPTIKPSILSLLQTCRQIHYEAEQIFYSCHNLRYTVLSLSDLPGLEADAKPSAYITDAHVPVVRRTYWLDFPGLESYKNMAADRRKTWPAFIRTLNPRRQQALHALTINAFTADWALGEITQNIPLASNLKILHIQLPLLAWETDDAAVAWARSVQTTLRATRIKEVRISHPGECIRGLGRGGAGNNSYAVIRERSRSERAWDLSRVVESMLRSIVED